MDVSQALELVDRLLYEDSGKRLNDLERQVFIGSWQGQTYEEIYPDNPEYVEKSVGYKLWQKLTKLSGDKVTKKTLHGFVSRLVQQQTCHRPPQSGLLFTTSDRPSFRKPCWNDHTAVEDVAPSAHSMQGLSPAPLVGPPVPTVDAELPQGQVRLDSAFYIERQPAEDQCYRAIGHPGTLIRIKAPRQMGKTSLMSRILYQAREQGYQTVPLSFQHADAEIFASLNQFLQWFCSRLARRLRLLHPVEEYWSDTFGSKDNCTAYFEDCVLSGLDSPLVLALDEVDRIFQYPTIADDFFGLLRAWYEEAGYGDSGSGLWEKLRLVIVHSTEVYIPLDVNQSPFNVGLPIELAEFSLEQVLELADRHHLSWHPTDGMALMQIVGGHPYLVRLALYHLAQQSLSLAEVLATAATESGVYADHLRRHLWNLQQHPILASALSQVVRAKEPIELDSISAFKLHSLGLVQMQGNQVVSRFELYRQYFHDRLQEP